MRQKKGPSRLAAMILVQALIAGLFSGCSSAPEQVEDTTDTVDTAVFQQKAELLRGAVLTGEVREELIEDPAGEAGYAVFLSVCGGTERASVYSGTGDTLDSAWDAAVLAADTALQQGGPLPLWLKADLVYVSAALPAGALQNMEEVFGAYGFRYGLAFDPGYETALLEAELNSTGIYDYEAGGVDLERLNAYLEESGRAPLASLPETYQAFQCAGWLCDETGAVFQLSLDDLDYGRREMNTTDGGIARALALDGAEYLAEQVQEDGSILLPGGEERLSAAEHADVLSAIIQGYRLLPSETLAKGIDRAAGWLLSQTAYTEDDVAYLPDHGEITLESSALALIALADCAETSGNTGYIPACEALGAGILSLLDTGTGSFTHVLDASDLGRKEAVRSAEWDGMGVTALCRLYGLTQDPLWLWAAELVLDRMIEEDPAQYGDVWTACALRAGPDGLFCLRAEARPGEHGLCLRRAGDRPRRAGDAAGFLRDLRCNAGRRLFRRRVCLRAAAGDHCCPGPASAGRLSLPGVRHVFCRAAEGAGGVHGPGGWSGHFRQRDVQEYRRLQSVCRILRQTCGGKAV